MNTKQFWVEDVTCSQMNIFTFFFLCKEKKTALRHYFEYVTTTTYSSHYFTGWLGHFLHPLQFTSQSAMYYRTHRVSDPIIIMPTHHYSGCYDALWMLICSPRTTYINLFSTKRHRRPLRVWPSLASSHNEENRVWSKVGTRVPPSLTVIFLLLIFRMNN